MAAATSSSSHLGVDVAPHTPTLSSGRNHSRRSSDTDPMCQVRVLLITLFAILLSCKEQEVPVFDPSDSLVRFSSTFTNFSLIGNTESEPVFDIELVLAGTASENDRIVSCEVVDNDTNSAIVGQDFSVVEALVPSGSQSGFIRIKVKAFDEDEFAKKTTTIRIVPNETFKYVYSGMDVTYVTWSNEYVRPAGEDVYRSWWYYFCKGYSQNYHKILVEILGEDVQYSSQFNSARKHDDIIYRAPSWWYSASRTLYDTVKKHDQEHPDSPYMHSEDYEEYSSYDKAVGSGKKPDTIPTILSTLLVM